MVRKFTMGLTKVSTRLHRFAGRRDNKQWPANVLDILERKYHLLPRDLLRLWYVQHKIMSKKVNTYSILIYDREKAHDLNLSIKEYNDLSKHPDLLLYKGHIFGNGEVNIEPIRAN